MIVPCLNAFALSGRVNIICCGITQGVASLALGYVLHWAFSPPLLNPKLQYIIYIGLSMSKAIFQAAYTLLAFSPFPDKDKYFLCEIPDFG